MVVVVIVMGVEGSVCVVMVVVVMSLAKENNHPETVRVLEQVSE